MIWKKSNEDHEKYYSSAGEKVLFIGENEEKTKYTICFEHCRSMTIKKFTGKGCEVWASLKEARNYLNQHAIAKGLRQCKDEE